MIHFTKLFYVLFYAKQSIFVYVAISEGLHFSRNILSP